MLFLSRGLYFLAFNEIAAHDVVWGSRGIVFGYNEAWEFDYGATHITALASISPYVPGSMAKRFS